jgi:hypothetical protein
MRFSPINPSVKRHARKAAIPLTTLMLFIHKWQPVIVVRSYKSEYPLQQGKLKMQHEKNRVEVIEAKG